MANPYEDVELDAVGMRALAHPVRVRILFELRGAPATATMLSKKVGASPSVTSWHLRHLSRHGLVADAPELGHGRERYWRSVGRGFRLVVTDEASQAAASSLQSVLDDVTGDVVGTWRRTTAPQLEPDWVAQSGSQDTTVTLTLTELRQLNDAIEQLLAPFVRRDDHPQGARPVRILRHTMPSSD